MTSDMGEVVMEVPEPVAPVTPIRIYPDPILQEIAPEAKPGPTMQDLFKRMIESMQTYGGIGIAAPQIGESVRAIIIKEGDNLHCVLNPKITWRNGIKISTDERCLSVPGLTRRRHRDQKVIVKGTDALGVPVKLILKDLPAACAQHEIDHLNGRTIVHR